jgi:D-mannonate dehydratase
MWNNAIGMYVFIMISFSFFFRKRIFVFFCRGKSTHPGVVVDLCQNPDDPTRVRIFGVNRIVSIWKNS